MLAGAALVLSCALIGPGALTLAAIFLLASHFAHPGAGLAAVLVAATAPMFYARPGAGVELAASSIATTALAVGVLGDGPRSARLMAAAVGVASIALALFDGRSLSGSAVAVASVALTWVLTRADGQRRALGVLACAVALLALVSPYVSSVEKRDALFADPLPAFDFTIAVTARELFPWSAPLPFALASMTVPYRAGPSSTRDRRGALQVLSLTGVVLSYAASQLPWTAGAAPLSVLSFAAVSLGVWLWDIARGTRAHATTLLAVTVLAALLALDLFRFPEQRALTFAPEASPDARAELAKLHISVPAILGAALALPALASLLGCIQSAWPACIRLVHRLRPRHRTRVVAACRGVPLLGTVLSALILRWAYYPSTSAALSPAGALGAFEAHARAGDQLGSFDLAQAVTPSRASHRSGEPAHAAQWLLGAGPERRFLLLPRERLPALNAELRRRRPGNVPLLEASGLTLLAVDRLAPDEASVSFLDALLIDSVPDGLRPIDAEFGGRVRALGWDLLDDRGTRIEQAGSHTRFRLRLYYQLERGELSGHCTFLHIDHRPSRFTAEHDWKVYPLSFWQPGDRIADEFEIDLPLHFSAGDYPVYFGFGVLPCRDDRRLPVTRGAHDRNRVRAGTLVVR